MNTAASAGAVVSGPDEADATPMPTDAVEVGRVMGAWGIKGGIRVKPFAADPQALFASKRWFLRPPEGPRPPGAKATAFPGSLRIVTAKQHGDGVVATASGLADRDAAEALKGARIFVPRISFPTPDEGEFYWVDLIGLAVVDRNAGASFPTPDEGEFYWIDLIGLQVHNRAGADLGEVIGLIETGPHCVLRIQPVDTRTEAEEVLIPFVDAYVDGVDLDARRIAVDWALDDAA
mgnify:CR=1 FL=1